MTCVVRGKIREIATIDLSKTASVENPYTEIFLEIEDATAVERKNDVTRDIVFFRQGKLPLKVGDCVELEVDALDWSKPTRLRILRHTKI
jgi:hypothetical protein